MPSPKTQPDELDAYADTLEASGDFKVLRRLRMPELTSRPLNPGERVAIVVDTETTGLNLRHDEATELAMLAFAYDQNGTITSILDAYSALREPSVPISPESASLTGITSSMVKGKRLDEAKVEAFLAPAALIIAHNAAFDRPICEKLSPAFAEKSWACTATQINWRGIGFEGTKLIYLLYQFGLFHHGHRAMDDAAGTLEILRRPFPSDGKTALPILLDNARSASVRMWLQTAPELAPSLRARGYRWHNGTATRRRSWWKEVDEAKAAAEIQFIEQQGPLVRSMEHKRITAFERFKLDL